jgi:hypothetical protein
VSANTGPARSATLTIAGQTFTVTQEASPPQPPACTFVVSPTSLSMKKKGGKEKVSVTAPSSCSWTSTSDVNWIGVSGSGSGNGTVSLSVEKNNGGFREGAVTIAGQSVTVSQNDKDDDR